MLHHSLEINEVACQNCGYVDSGVYCSECGKVLKKNRISIRVILMSVINAISGVESKYSETTKAMLKNPIAFIKDYIYGNRDKYCLPFKFYLFNVGINLFIYTYFDLGSFNAQSLADDDALKFQSEVMFDQIMSNYGNLFLLFIIPLFVMICSILFPKSQYNSAEKATAITYMLGFLLLFEILINLVSVAYNPFLILGRQLVRILEVGIIFLLSYKFFNQSIFKAIWKTTIIILTIIFSMKILLMGFMEILIMICKE